MAWFKINNTTFYFLHKMNRPIQADDEGHSFILPSFGGLHEAIVNNVPVTSSLATKITDTLYQGMVKLSM